jgi:hypothetical protein
MRRSNLNDADQSLHDRVEAILMKGLDTSRRDSHPKRTEAADATSRKTIPLFSQPEPVTTLVGRLRGITAITRVWENGDQNRCSLCRQCDASNGVCSVLTTRTVADDDAEMFSCPEI